MCYPAWLTCPVCLWAPRWEPGSRWADTLARPLWNKATHGHMYLESYIYTIILLSLYVCLSVGVRKLQVTILVRSSREMSLTVRIIWQYILSRIRISVRPGIFLYAKNIHKLSRRPTLSCVAVEWANGTGNNVVTVEWPAIRRSRNNCGNT